MLSAQTATAVSGHASAAPPASVRAQTTPERPKMVRGRFHLRTSGRVLLPRGVRICPPGNGGGNRTPNSSGNGTTPNQYCVDFGHECDGLVSVRFKYHRETISLRRAKVRRGPHDECAFRSTVDIHNDRLRKIKRRGPVRLRVFVRFLGNGSLSIGPEHKQLVVLTR